MKHTKCLRHIKPQKEFFMKKRFLMILVLAVIFTGLAYAEEQNLGTINNDFLLSPMQHDWRAQQAAAAAPMRAGMLNTLFGLWSWMNGDILGGALTAGIEVGGLAIMIIGSSIVGSSEEPSIGATFGVTMGGAAVFLGGAIFGYFRGSSQYKKQQDATAMGFDSNPIERINFVPTLSPDGKNMGFGLLYSAKF
jgi:hypothetical protein